MMLIFVIDGLRHIPVVLILNTKPNGKDFGKQHLVRSSQEGSMLRSVLQLCTFPINSGKLLFKNSPNSFEYSMEEEFHAPLGLQMHNGRDSSVGIATGYGLGGPWIEFR